MDLQAHSHHWLQLIGLCTSVAAGMTRAVGKSGLLGAAAWIQERCA